MFESRPERSNVILGCSNHDVGVRITPGAVQRVQGIGDSHPLAVATLRSLHQQVRPSHVPSPGGRSRRRLVGINEHVVGAAGSPPASYPRWKYRRTRRVGGIRTGSFPSTPPHSRRHHVLQVHAESEPIPSFAVGCAGSAPAQKHPAGSGNRLIHCGTLQGQGLLGRAGTLRIEGDIGASHASRRQASVPHAAACAGSP